MRKLTIVALAMMAAALLVSATAFAQPAPKVDVCHREGNGSYHMINISENALDAHLNHGDAMPGTVVDDQYVGDDCSVSEVQRVESSTQFFGPNGWAGWSCPAGTTAVGGGFESAPGNPGEGDIAAQGLAVPGSTVAGETYPVFPHYTFSAGETGWVVQNDNDAGEQLIIYVYCAAD